MWLAAFVVMALLILSNAPTPLYVHWQTNFRFSMSVLSSLFSIYVAALLATLAIAGQLCDRFGPRAVLLPGLVASLLACALFFSAHSVPALLLARFASGIGVGVAATAGVAYVVELGGPTRARQAALIASTAVALGAALGPLLSGSLAQFAMRYDSFFAIEAIVLALAAGVVVLLPAQGHPRAGCSSRWRFPTTPSAQRQQMTIAVTVFGSVLCATAFLLSLGPSLLSDLYGVHSPLIAGAMAGLMFAAGALAQPPARQLSLRSIFIWCTALLLAAMVAVALAVFSRTSGPLIAAALFAGGAYGLAQLAGVTLIARDVPAAHRGESNAVFNIGGYVPCGLAPVFAGLLTEQTDLETATLIFAGIVATAGVVSCALAVRRFRDSADQPAAERA